MSEKEERLLTKIDEMYSKLTNSDPSKSAGIVNQVIELNRQVLDVNPKNPYARMNLGQIYYDISDKTEDDAEHRKLLKKAESELLKGDNSDNPEREKLYKYLMGIYRAGLDQENYIKMREKLKNLYKEEGRPLGDYYYLLSSDDSGVEKYGDTIYEYVKNTGDTAGFGNYFAKYASVLLVYKKYEKCIEAGNFINKTYPNDEWVADGGVYQDVALSCMALGRWEEAIEAWKGYINMLPIKGIENGYLNITYCFLMLNNEDEAYKNWINYLVSGENNKKFNFENQKEISKIRRNQYQIDGFGNLMAEEIRGKFSVYNANIRVYKELENIIKREIDVDLNNNKILSLVNEYLLKYNLNFDISKRTSKSPKKE